MSKTSRPIAEEIHILELTTDPYSYCTCIHPHPQTLKLKCFKLCTKIWFSCYRYNSQTQSSTLSDYWKWKSLILCFSFSLGMISAEEKSSGKVEKLTTMIHLKESIHFQLQFFFLYLSTICHESSRRPCVPSFDLEFRRYGFLNWLKLDCFYKVLQWWCYFIGQPVSSYQPGSLDKTQ